MTQEDELRKLSDATLERLSVERLGPTEGTSEIVVSVRPDPGEEPLPDPAEGPLEEPMRSSLATHLAAEANRAMGERGVVGLERASLAYVDGSYQLTLSVVTADQ